MFNIGSCHVALVESTGTSVSQADGFLCGTEGGKDTLPLAAQIHRSGLTAAGLTAKKKPPNMQVGKKKQPKSCSFGRAFAHSSEHNSFSSVPSLSTRVRGILEDKEEGEKTEISKIEEIRIRSRAIVQGCSP